MTTEPIHPTLRDLAAEIGQVLIYWSFLESAMRQQLVDARSRANLSRGPIISHWRSYLLGLPETAHSHLLADVERVAAGRNLLAHGIQSVTADPWKPASAIVTCTAPDGAAHVLTIDDVRELAQSIDGVRLAIRRAPVPVGDSGSSVTP